MSIPTGIDGDAPVRYAQRREGHDVQLEKAVQVVMDQLKKQPLPVAKKPAPVITPLTVLVNSAVALLVDWRMK